LTRAESRIRILEQLSGGGPATQRELRERIDASRTTIARSLRSLEEHGWVERDDGAHRLTRVGEIVADEFTALLETMRVTAELSTFLRWFPSDEPAPDFLAVDDVRVTSSTEGDPYAPARRQAEILTAVDQLRILLPSIDLEATKTIAEQVTERGLEVETIVSPEVKATLESGQFASLLREKLEAGRSTIFVADSALPFYLGLADDGRVQIGVEDDEGFPRALLETTDERVRSWGEKTYREFRESATRKPLEDFE
jgi:predicted transcriptional regulator